MTTQFPKINTTFHNNTVIFHVLPDSVPIENKKYTLNHHGYIIEVERIGEIVTTTVSLPISNDQS